MNMFYSTKSESTIFLRNINTTPRVFWARFG